MSSDSDKLRYETARAIDKADEARRDYYNASGTKSEKIKYRNLQRAVKEKDRKMREYDRASSRK